MNLFLDDRKDAPEGYICFRPENLGTFYHLARHCRGVISMDHDLGDGYPEGYDILKKIELEVQQGKMWTEGAPKIVVHSENPVGADNMRAVIRSIYKMVGKIPTYCKICLRPVEPGDKYCSSCE